MTTGARIARTGFFGKLPALGDFVQRGLPAAFVERWDDWLRMVLAGSRAELESSWLPAYQQCPPWRFALAAGTVGPSVWAGVVMPPSLDRVEREFPVTFAGEWPADVSPLALAVDGGAWFEALERLALETLDAQELDPDDLFARLSATDAPFGRVAPCADSSAPWCGVLEPSEDLSRAWLGSIERELAPVTVWWTVGASDSDGRWALCRGLPTVGDVCRALRAYVGASDDAPAAKAGTSPVPAVIGGHAEARWRSAGTSHAGRVRPSNQDAWFADDALGVWVVADGLGGHRHGEYASRCVADAVARRLDACDPPGSRLQQVRLALEDANAELRARGATDPEFSGSGSTVVAVIVEGRSATVLWAGDSRAYRWRRGDLVLLTRDHAIATEDGAPTHEIMHAVGAADELHVEEIEVELEPGDRLLLCSDGVHGALPEDVLETLLDSMRTPDVVCAAIQRAVLAGKAEDNLTAVVAEWHVSPPTA